MTHLEEFVRVLDMMGLWYMREEVTVGAVGTIITCVAEFWFDESGKFVCARLVE